MMTMKDAIHAQKQLRLLQFEEHRALHRGMNEIRGFTQDEWDQQVTLMKSSYGAKGKKHSHTKLWAHYNITVETL
tara:strand:- start:415 stop:639 length:225 start_codon:yes stop_codon:yes gene_type:complete